LGKDVHFYFYKTIFETHLFNMNMRFLSAVCFSVAISVAGTTAVKAQGESDPGFSTVGALSSGSSLAFTDYEYEYQKASFSVANTFAKAERDTKLDIPSLQVRIPIAETGYFDVKLPIYAATGELAHIWGLGDLYATYTHVVKSEYNEEWQFQLTGGAMFGMGTGNRTDGKTRPLPMVYQSNLGSTDVILGVNATWKNYVTFAVGYQQPVFRYNENEYDRSSIVNDTIYSHNSYELARKLYRNGDLLFRLEGHYGSSRIGISGGPLLLYHLRNDLMTDRSGTVTEIEGSKGFTLNLGADVYLRLGRRGEAKLDLAGVVPVSHRDAIPDGLSRQWILTPRFTWFFGQETLLFKGL
jgi:hypothetical protein